MSDTPRMYTFQLSGNECMLIADALDVINPDEIEQAELAQALAHQFRYILEGGA